MSIRRETTPFLKNSNFQVTVRWSKGTKIAAGCGQLISKYLN